MTINVYLSGEIHSEWRNEIIDACEGLNISFSSPIANHDLSDSIGNDILGIEENKFWYDHKSAKINAIRIKTLIECADVVVVKFGDKYRQWNAAFDAGYASALGTPVISLHSPDLTHPLKEVDAAAMATAETPEQVAQILKYVITQQDKIDS